MSTPEKLPAARPPVPSGTPAPSAVTPLAAPAKVTPSPPLGQNLICEVCRQPATFEVMEMRQASKTVRLLEPVLHRFCDEHKETGRKGKV